MGNEWIKGPKGNPPPEGVLVEVRGYDYMGEWRAELMRRTYKTSAHNWRWVDSNGNRFEEQNVDAWRELQE